MFFFFFFLLGLHRVSFASCAFVLYLIRVFLYTMCLISFVLFLVIVVHLGLPIVPSMLAVFILYYFLVVFHSPQSEASFATTAFLLGLMYSYFICCLNLVVFVCWLVEYWVTFMVVWFPGWSGSLLVLFLILPICDML